MEKVNKLIQVLDKYSLFPAAFLAIIYALVGSIVSVVRFRQYDVFFYDFGIFDKAIWEVSRFSVPIIDHMVIGEKIIFADHFSPSIFLLSPIFWIFPSGESLLIAQAVAVAASGFILFLIGKHVLKNSYAALSILLSYFLFVGLQNAIITDFHEVTLATLFFMLTYYFLIKEKKLLYFISLILLLGCKETMFLIGIGIGISVLFLKPTFRKIAIWSILLSIVWGLISIKIVIPFFSRGGYLYSSQIPTNPIAIVISFFNSPVKRNTMLFSFLSFGFLPLLSPAFWFILFQDFLTRFYPDFPTRWGLGFHYSAMLAAIMGVSSIFSLKMLTKKFKPLYTNSLLIILVITSAFIYRVTLHGPFALSYNPAFYNHTKDFMFLDDALKRIPKNASVMTQNNLAPHFTHQKMWHLVSDIKTYQGEYYLTKNPDYILIDNHPGQNPNNFFGVKDMKILLSNLDSDKNYKRIYMENGLMIYRRIKR